MTQQELKALYVRIRQHEFDVSKSDLKGAALTKEREARVALFRREVGLLTGLYNHPREERFWVAIGPCFTQKDQGNALFAASVLGFTMESDDPTFPYKMMDF